MIGPEIAVPDVTEAVVDYRQFRLVRASQHNYQLIGLHTEDVWPTPKMTAKCNKTIKSEHVVLDGIRPRQHSAPAKDCGCGIYAYFEPSMVPDYRSMHMYSSRWAMERKGEEIAALVTMSGRIEVHARGMRSQYATICALGLNANLSSDEKAALLEIGKRWGVPVVAQGELEALSTEYGRPLAPSLRPARENPEAKHPAIREAKEAADKANAILHETMAVCEPPRRRSRLARFMAFWVPNVPVRWNIALNYGLAAMNATFSLIAHEPWSLAALAFNLWYAAFLHGIRHEKNRA